MEVSRVESYERLGSGLGLGQITPSSKVPIIETAVGTGTSLTASLLVAAGVAGPAAPIVAAIGAIAVPIISLFSGCGQTCIQATQYANQADDAAQQIFDTYFAQPTPRLKSTQQAALQAINQMMQALYQACNNPALGSAGQRCISERIVRGGSAPWCPTRTGCDWYSIYIDPITNDPNVIDDSLVPVATSAPTSSEAVSNLLSGNSGMMIILAIAILLTGAYIAQGGLD